MFTGLDRLGRGHENGSSINPLRRGSRYFVVEKLPRTPIQRKSSSTNFTPPTKGPSSQLKPKSVGVFRIYLATRNGKQIRIIWFPYYVCLQGVLSKIEGCWPQWLCGLHLRRQESWIDFRMVSKDGTDVALSQVSHSKPGENVVTLRFSSD